MIVGLAGKARSGKDTVADYLASLLGGYDFLKTGFADELKKQVMRHFCLSFDQLYGSKKEKPDTRYKRMDKNSFWTPREIMQKYGEFMRSIDSEYWVNILFRSAEERGYSNILITDVRYKNEAHACKERGGHLVKVVRDGADRIADSSHISENDLDDYEDFDFVIDNNGGLDDLKENTKKLANIIKNELDSFKLMEVRNG